MTASSERPPRSPAKMMWTTCLRRGDVPGAIEATIATGPRRARGVCAPLSQLGDERLAPIGVQEDDTDLASVAGVDQARGVHDRDAVTRREARPWLDEAGIAFRGGAGDPGRPGGALAGSQLDPLAGREGGGGGTPRRA